MKRAKKYLKDEVANIILADESCRDYVIKLASLALNIEESIIRSNLRLVTTRISNNVNVEYSYVDTIYENDTSVINIEVNYADSVTLQKKNMKYACQLVLRQTMSVSNKLKPIYQININNYDVFNKGKFIYRISIREESLNIKRTDYITIIDINVDFLCNLTYNEIMEGEEYSLEKLLYVFVSDDNNTLDKLYLNDVIMENVREKLNTLTEDFDSILYYDRDELWKEVSYEQGVKEGEKTTIINMVKKMLEEELDDDFICKIANISKEELEKIKKSN